MQIQIIVLLEAVLQAISSVFNTRNNNDQADVEVAERMLRRLQTIKTQDALPGKKI